LWDALDSLQYRDPAASTARRSRFYRFSQDIQAHRLTLPRDYAPAMERIEIRTFRQILEHEHQLARWCPGCRR
jgi:hypothetical protein